MIKSLTYPLALAFLLLLTAPAFPEDGIMKYADASKGRPFSKDPAVVNFNGKYWMYYSLPPYPDQRENNGWSIGVSTSDDLLHWRKVGDIAPEKEGAEKKGICAPGAIVLNGKVHLFYQTYGNGRDDAICHAVSSDGLHFTRNATNPIFSPTGEWNAGRAIDADVIAFKDQLFLYFATRDPEMKIQMVGVATAPLDSDFSRDQWTQRCDKPILHPELPWEKACIEAPALCEHNGTLYMFYAGGYNNEPQQVGCAVSNDGLTWTRLFDEPFLPNGKPGTWNASESGHPYLFTDEDGQMFLFFQGNNDHGKSWYLSQKQVFWDSNTPYLK
jgi:beta-1,2-mannobiose phosphorylase / 1,2-beta-oligomannan phosphorylase